MKSPVEFVRRINIILLLFLTLASLLNVPGNGVWDQLVDDILKISGRNLPLDDVDHLLTDVADLRRDDWYIRRQYMEEEQCKKEDKEHEEQRQRTCPA